MHLGIGQTCITRSGVETYYEGTLVPDRCFRAEGGEFSTERYFLQQYVGLGEEYDAVLGAELIYFYGSAVTTHAWLQH